MDPKITSAIWSNIEFDQATPAGKLAALWLITNEHVDMLGYADLSLRRFVFETQLDEQALAEGFKALGKGLEKVGKGYWLRNYIGVQFGRGPSLCRNNFARGITKRLGGGCDPALVRLILAEYVELLEVKGFVSPIKVLGKGSRGSMNHKRGKDRIGEDRSRAEQRGGAGGELLTETDSTEAPTNGSSNLMPAEEIYAEYPLKVARANALRAIDKALGTHPADMLLAATRAYAEAVSHWPPEARSQYVPHAATWFNRESYLDDRSAWERLSAPGKNSTGVAPRATITRDPVIFKD